MFVVHTTLLFRKINFLEAFALICYTYILSNGSLKSFNEFVWCVDFLNWNPKNFKHYRNSNLFYNRSIIVFSWVHFVKSIPFREFMIFVYFHFNRDFSFILYILYSLTAAWKNYRQLYSTFLNSLSCTYRKSVLHWLHITDSTCAGYGHYLVSKAIKLVRATMHLIK